MQRIPRVLICDDDELIHLAVKHSLKGLFECRSARHGDEALAILRSASFDVMLLDIQMRTDDEGLTLIPKIRELDPSLAILMSSGRTDVEAFRQAMRAGAMDYVPKDAGPDELRHSLERALERRSLRARTERQDAELARNHASHPLIGQSPACQTLRRQLERLRSSSASVLLTGESGTGKEVAARQLRRHLADGSLEPFVAIDSGTIQATTAESILFGHEKGAFTGADKTTRGLFEEANGGTIYFDEIGNMPLEIQAKLLRVLQEREITRLGSTKPLQLEFRLIAATNKNLEKLVEAGQFKDDLYQRLNVIPIQIPPLRERPEDIPLLLEHFSCLACPGRRLMFDRDAAEVLSAYSWPGNIRELVNLVSYVAAMTDGDLITEADLPPRFREQARPASKPSSAESFYDRVSQFERSILLEAYEQEAGNVSRLALRIGMDRSHLYKKLRTHGIHAPS